MAEVGKCCSVQTDIQCTFEVVRSAIKPLVTQIASLEAEFRSLRSAIGGEVLAIAPSLILPNEVAEPTHGLDELSSPVPQLDAAADVRSHGRWSVLSSDLAINLLADDIENAASGMADVPSREELSNHDCEQIHTQCDPQRKTDTSLPQPVVREVCGVTEHAQQAQQNEQEKLGIDVGGESVTSPLSLMRESGPVQCKQIFHQMLQNEIHQLMHENQEEQQQEQAEHQAKHEHVQHEEQELLVQPQLEIQGFSSNAHSGNSFGVEASQSARHPCRMESCTTAFSDPRSDHRDQGQPETSEFKITPENLSDTVATLLQIDQGVGHTIARVPSEKTLFEESQSSAPLCTTTLLDTAAGLGPSVSDPVLCAYPEASRPDEIPVTCIVPPARMEPSGGSLTQAIAQNVVPGVSATPVMAGHSLLFSAAPGAVLMSQTSGGSVKLMATAAMPQSLVQSGAQTSSHHENRLGGRSPSISVPSRTSPPRIPHASDAALTGVPGSSYTPPILDNRTMSPFGRGPQQHHVPLPFAATHPKPQANAHVSRQAPTRSPPQGQVVLSWSSVSHPRAATPGSHQPRKESQTHLQTWAGPDRVAGATPERSSQPNCARQLQVPMPPGIPVMERSNATRRPSQALQCH